VAPAGAVVNGKPVPAGHFGYVANVEIFGMQECSGVLLAPSWVVTAGHCASIVGALSEGLAPAPVTFPASAYTVYLGTPNADGSGGERHTVSQVVLDPKFLVANGDGNDEALLHLSTPSRQPTVKIAPDVPRLWRAGVKATVAGFGTTSESSSVKPPTMRYAQVPFVTDAYCAATYPFGADIVANDGWYDPDTMVCAGYPQGGTDVCEGDSGGPILAPVTGAKLELIGTTSFGHGCAEPGYPTAYALAAAGPIRSFLEQYVPAAFATATQATPRAKPKAAGKRHAKKRKRRARPQKRGRRDARL
jgi:secreted trypsin-like serine protease